MRLAPTWVPREFCTPGRRIRLHPDDYYPFGPGRGGVDERWLASAIRADNGPRTGPFEGLSLVVGPDGPLIPFDEFVAHHGAALIGSRLWDQFGRWPMYSKFFDNQQALPFHFHQTDEDAARVGKVGKPEAYYYSPHMNHTLGDQPISFLGLQPETTRAQLRERLERFTQGGDNHITDLSRGYRTQLGTGWDIPVGVLHAPASVCTYEPQAASDVFCMCESWSNNREVPAELMWKDVPRGPRRRYRLRHRPARLGPERRPELRDEPIHAAIRDPLVTRVGRTGGRMLGRLPLPRGQRQGAQPCGLVPR